VLPGERLPAERTLARDLRVSRLTVREALRTLQEEGAIVTRRGAAGGAYVVGRSGTLDPAHMLEVFEFRLAVETAAARLAAERRTTADLERLAEHGGALETSEDAGAFRRADSAFHLAIADASANAMLRASIEDARAATFDAFDEIPFTVLRDTTADGHAAIARAIERRDGADAAGTMAAHLERALAEVLAVLRGA
jgi:DNA-binding FadR family transcriptional regulator